MKRGPQMLDRKVPFRLVMALGDWAAENIKRFLSREKVAGIVRREDYL
jgi:hypothetical protein